MYSVKCVCPLFRNYQMLIAIMFLLQFFHYTLSLHVLCLFSIILYMYKIIYLQLASNIS